MWHPIDPDEPTSELYRLMPSSRRRSEFREALDAATGIDHRPDAGGSEVIPSGAAHGKASWHTRPFARWAGPAATALAVTIVGGIIATLISGWLTGSSGQPSQRTPTRSTTFLPARHT